VPELKKVLQEIRWIASLTIIPCVANNQRRKKGISFNWQLLLKPVESFIKL
jgi:hypothetical protein